MVIGATPIMYPKLLTKYEPVRNPETPPEITSNFYDLKDNKILPDELMGSRCSIIAAVTVKDIYIGVIPSIQLKLNRMRCGMILVFFHELLSVIIKMLNARFCERKI